MGSGSTAVWRTVVKLAAKIGVLTSLLASRLAGTKTSERKS